MNSVPGGPEISSICSRMNDRGSNTIGLAKGRDRAVAIGNPQPGNVVNRFALILAARVAHVEAVEETHLFRRDTAGLKDAPTRPVGELSEWEVSRNQIGRIGIESEAAGEVCSAFSPRPASSSASVRSETTRGRGTTNMLNGIPVAAVPGTLLTNNTSPRDNDLLMGVCIWIVNAKRHVRYSCRLPKYEPYLQ